MSDVFCEECLGASSDDSPGNVSAVNGIGRKFYGGADTCGRCGSVVKTLWVVFVGIPLIPRGSYRFKATDDTNVFSVSFQARRTATHWPQIFRTWLVGLLIGVVGFYIIWATR